MLADWALVAEHAAADAHDACRCCGVRWDLPQLMRVMLALLGLIIHSAAADAHDAC